MCYGKVWQELSISSALLSSFCFLFAVVSQHSAGTGRRVGIDSWGLARAGKSKQVLFVVGLSCFV